MDFCLIDVQDLPLPQSIRTQFPACQTDSTDYHSIEQEFRNCHRIVQFYT